MRTIWLAALIALTTCGGAPTGGIARPPRIFAFLAGAVRGPPCAPPPLLPGPAADLRLLGGRVARIARRDAARVPGCRRGPAGGVGERRGGKQACRHAQQARREQDCAAKTHLFRPPAGLADGLALKELAPLLP